MTKFIVYLFQIVKIKYNKCIFVITVCILRANANRNNDLQSAVFDGGRRTAPLSAPLYALCQSHIVALAAAAQPAKHNYVVLCNRGQYIRKFYSRLPIRIVGIPCTPGDAFLLGFDRI